MKDIIGIGTGMFLEITGIAYVKTSYPDVAAFLYQPIICIPLGIVALSFIAFIFYLEYREIHNNIKELEKDIKK